MANVDQIVAKDNTEAYASNKLSWVARQVEQKFDERFSKDFLAKAIVDKNGDGDVAIQEYNAAKEDLEDMYEQKHAGEDIELTTLHDESLELQWVISQSLSPEQQIAVTDPFAYARAYQAQRNQQHITSV